MAATPSKRFAPFERLRSIATPEREIQELIANLEPGTELDSIIRELLTRILMQADGPITVDMEAPVHGNLRWEETVYNPHPGVFRRMTTIWHEP